MPPRRALEEAGEAGAKKHTPEGDESIQHKAMDHAVHGRDVDQKHPANEEFGENINASAGIESDHDHHGEDETLHEHAGHAKHVAPDEHDALALAAAVEGDSEHTIARGIRRSAEERGVTPPVVSAFEAIQGRGVRARRDGKAVYIGGPRLLKMLELDWRDSLAAFETAASEKGQSVVNRVERKQIVTAFALADVIRPESREAVQRLHEMGVEVAMLTGDSKAVAKAVAEELGIDTYFAEVLPEYKDQQVAELQQQGKRVAMVGDGVNDAPALTRADVGIAIGSGTDVAVESAGIILVRNDPRDAVSIIGLSRASYRKMIQNLIWATGYNVVALPLAAGVLAPVGVLLSPAVGAALMALSTVIVAINAQFLRRYKFEA